jgi:hypothetical protein
MYIELQPQELKDKKRGRVDRHENTFLLVCLARIAFTKKVRCSRVRWKHIEKIGVGVYSLTQLREDKITFYLVL